MLSSYFEIPYWQADINFNRHDICYITGSNGAITYYYCLNNNNLGDNPIASSFWTNSFQWIPSYNTSSEITLGTEVTETNFPLTIAQGINNELIKTNLIFENRSESEAKAISHYITVRRGTEPFRLSHYLFNGSGSIFVAYDLNIDYVYNNLYNISFLIEQTPL